MTSIHGHRAVFVGVLLWSMSTVTLAHAQTRMPWEPHPVESVDPYVKQDVPNPLWTDAKEGERNRRASDAVQLDTFEKISEQTRDAVVNIEIELPQNPAFPGLESVGKGSGFLIHPDGYIVTNAHVVNIAEAIHVTTADRKVYDASIVGMDPETDIALIRLILPDGQKHTFSTLALASSATVKPGQWIVAIGNPYGLNHTLTTGIVSAVGRRALSNQLRLMYTNFIQIDAAINLGNSGGPLLNLDGHVVGMNTALQSGNDIGFAIPSDMIREVLTQMMEGDLTRAWSGVTVQDLSVESAKNLANGRDGARVIGVEKEGPAEKAGVKRGDIIVAFNKKKVEDSEQLRWWLAMSRIGTPQDVEVIRGGRHVHLALIPEKTKPQKVAGQARVKAPVQPEEKPAGPSAFGVVVAETPQRAEGETSAVTPGVQVLWVEPSSPAAVSGLRAGDVLTHINDAPIASVQDFERMGKAAEQSAKIALRAIRGHARLFLFFQLPQ